MINAAQGFLMVVYSSMWYRELAPTLKPISGEVPRPRIPNDRELVVLLFEGGRRGALCSLFKCSQPLILVRLCLVLVRIQVVCVV